MTESQQIPSLIDSIIADRKERANKLAAVRDKLDALIHALEHVRQKSIPYENDADGKLGSGLDLTPIFRPDPNFSFVDFYFNRDRVLPTGFLVHRVWMLRENEAGLTLLGQFGRTTGIDIGYVFHQSQVVLAVPSLVQTELRIHPSPDGRHVAAPLHMSEESEVRTMQVPK